MQIRSQQEESMNDFNPKKPALKYVPVYVLAFACAWCAYQLAFDVWVVPNGYTYTEVATFRILGTIMMACGAVLFAMVPQMVYRALYVFSRIWVFFPKTQA